MVRLPSAVPSAVLSGPSIPRWLAFLLALILTCPLLQARPPRRAQPRAAVPGFQQTSSGLKFADMFPGRGEAPRPGQTVVVLYRGWIYDTALGRQGRLFEQVTHPKRPFRFVLGEGKVIPGWEEGLTTLKKGGKRVLIVPPELAYGAEGCGKTIPPGATLLYEVTLLRIEGQGRPEPQPGDNPVQR